MTIPLLAPFAFALAQAATPAPPPAAAPEPPGRFSTVTSSPWPVRPGDVASIDSIVAALYDVISGPPGQKRDWDRMRSLFVADARLMPKGRSGLRVGRVEDYIAVSGPMLEQRGFVEQEIARRTERYGDIAHVFSTYQARNRPGGPIIMRGINSIQLVRHGGRWWVVSLMWQPESRELPLPRHYLKGAKRR